MTGRRSAILGAVALLALDAAPARAQVSSFLDGLFGRKPSAEEPALRPGSSPADPAPAGPAAGSGIDAAAPIARAPLPPRRPTALGGRVNDPGTTATAGDPVAEPPAAPAARVAVAAPPAASPGPPTTREAVVQRANAYFNGVSTLTGDFIQTGADGRRIGGRITVARPGRVRFDYDAPSSLEVIADGNSVAVRDRKLATQDVYPLSQTPLKFLLSDPIDLARDATVTEVATEPGGVRLAIEDRTTFGGTSRIVLHFDPEMRTLTQWRITDPQGYVTTVALSNLERGRRVDARLFVINYERVLDDRK